MDNNIAELIADYLSDSLDSKTRMDFEQQIAASPKLAARIALERDLFQTLGAHAPENQLRATLQHISTKYDSPESLGSMPEQTPAGKTWLWWVLAAGLLCSAGLLFWQLNRQGKPASVLPPAPNMESPAQAPVEALPKKPEADKTEAPEKTQPIATALKPLPTLESYIGSQTRSGDYHIRVDAPKSGMNLPSRSGQISFRLSGKMEGALPAGTNFNVLIFSNNPRDFEASRPVESIALELNTAGDFLFRKQLSLSPGLYYLLFEDRQSGEWVHTDKFFVK